VPQGQNLDAHGYLVQKGIQNRRINERSTVKNYATRSEPGSFPDEAKDRVAAMAGCFREDQRAWKNGVRHNT
jgi:hypothetical protein